MYIHKSHSKKDLRELFKELGYKFNSALNKREIIIQINQLLKKNIKINPENSYNINNLNDLVNHLTKPNFNEKISIEKKKEVMLRAKRIIQFAKNEYNFNGSFYKDIGTVHTDTIFISAYGFLPTVRRACNLYNKCMFKVDHINAVIPVRIQKELEENIKVKKKQIYNLQIKRGKIMVYFD
tara:strand:+ start:1334 stop:1876 length:543 start_codon:yes stop_codon:yes gene_type:complete